MKISTVRTPKNRRGRAPLMDSMVEFVRPDGKTAPGYLRCGVKVARIAGESFCSKNGGGLTNASKPLPIVLPRTTSMSSCRISTADAHATTPDEATHLMEGLDFSDAATQDAAGAAELSSRARAKHVGVMGFCMGGALAMLCVIHGREFDAASIWYGYPPADAGDPGKSSFPFKGTGRSTTATSPLRAWKRLKRSLKRATSPTSFTATTPSTAFTTRANPAREASGIIIGSMPKPRGSARSTFSIARCDRWSRVLLFAQVGQRGKQSSAIFFK